MNGMHDISIDEYRMGMGMTPDEKSLLERLEEAHGILFVAWAEARETSPDIGVLLGDLVDDIRDLAGYVREAS